MNSFLFIFTIAFYMGGVITSFRLFGKTGLYVWTAFSAIVSNIEALVMVDIFGLHLTLGNALYASSFLVTDLLSERYGRRAANRAVSIGLFTTMIWIAATQFILMFTPNSMDFITPALGMLFGLTPRIAFASILTYMVSQRIDIKLYHFWWNRTGNGYRGLWLRNNGSTLISQLLDTIMFTLVAFVGILGLKEMLELCVTTYIVKAFISVCDTPMLYLARSMEAGDE